MRHQTGDEMKTQDDNELTMCTEIMHIHLGHRAV